ncbi:MAG TPA: hypothetical protein VM580_21380 [Labilithrix sp.]|nr:hypothetical protein [Labilithrix sp.]
MIARGGCLATVRTVEGGAGSTDELRVRCPKPERIKTWFEGADRVAATLALEPLTREEDEEIEVSLPVAKLLTTSGKAFRVANAADVEKLAREVRALSADASSAEQVTPGPATGKGWQMLHVMGPAHVLVAGVPATGTLEARVSSTGQYLCEFVTNVDDGPIRATKSGWLSSATAGRAIDDALEAFRDPGPNEKSTTTYAAGTKGGSEVRTARSSTGEVFERFAEIQEALGDACLPELEAPSVSPADL